MTHGRRSGLWTTLDNWPTACHVHFAPVFRGNPRQRRTFFVGFGLLGILLLPFLLIAKVFLKGLAVVFGMVAVAVIFVAVGIALSGLAVVHQGAINFGEWRFERKYPQTVS